MHHHGLAAGSAMTESEPLHPQRQFVAFAFVLLIALSFISTLAWNIDPHVGNYGVRNVSAREAKAMLDAGAVAIDVREKAVAASSHLPGSLLIPLEVLHANLARLEAYKARPVVVYCGNGSSRGPEAAALLGRAGFSKVVNLRYGIEGWRTAGLPTENNG
jgi:rhodanese-related sulfurtransferase